MDRVRSARGRAPAVATIAIAIALGMGGGSPAHAAGINLSWNDCGTFGSDLVSFACNTNSGFTEAIASFVPPGGVDALCGVEATIGIESQGDLPDWWKHGNGFCRGTVGLSAGFDFTTGGVSCLDPWEGQAVGGLAYDVAYGGANLARLRVIAALPAGAEHPVDAASEYAAFRVRIMHSKSAGTGACAGCATPMRLTLQSLQLDQPAALADNRLLTNPIANVQIYWQNHFGVLPQIDGFTPAGGVPGDPVTITGARFTGATAVRFAGTDAPFDLTGDGEIHATVPNGARTGFVTVEAAAGLATSAARFIVAPVITAVTPGAGAVGTTITITGFNFTETSRVEFNGVSAPFVVGSDTELYPRVPDGATDGPITVVNAGGSAVSAETFYVGPLPAGEGTINLSWNDCGIAGSEVAAFACNTSTGPFFTMVGSFAAPQNIDALNGITAEISVLGLSSTLPDWWRFGPGQCRSTGLAASFDFTAGPFACLDPWGGQAVGGFVYDIAYGGPDRARMRVLAAVPAGLEQPLTPGGQYYAFKVMINRTHTTGTGSCSGCSVPMRFTLEQIQLYQPADRGYNPILTDVADRNQVYWQSDVGFPATRPPTTDVPPAAVAQLVIEGARVSGDGRALAFAVVLPDDAPVSLGIFDSGGRRLLTNRLEGAARGPYEWRVESARALPPGVYFARIVQSSRSAVWRFTVLR